MLRPQPIGVFPGMAGFFLLPPVPEGAPRISLLLRGHLPDAWPESWQFFAAAIAGRSEEEVTALLPEGPEGLYNRFVLTPQSDTYAWAKERVPVTWAPASRSIAIRPGSGVTADSSNAVMTSARTCRSWPHSRPRSGSSFS